MTTWDRLKSIQVQAARVTTGAYQATSPQALNVEAFLILIELTIQETPLLADLRICTSPSYHELKAQPTRHERRRRLGYSTPLQS